MRLPFVADSRPASGLSMHLNGVVWECFPKGADFRQVTDARVMAVQGRTGTRPRKAHGQLTPAEVLRMA